MIRDYVGNISQCAGITDTTVNGGKAKGLRLLELYNAQGLRATVMPDKCLDLLNFSYKGVNFAFINKNGATSPVKYNFNKDEFASSWSAGMLTTCGLSNIGTPCEDEGEYHSLHGKIHFQGADNLCVSADFVKDDYLMEISGKMGETELFGRNFSLKRNISLSLYSKELTIKDVVSNHDTKPRKFAVMYHSNFGYPLLDEGTRVVKPKGEIKPRAKEFESAMKDWAIIQPPKDEVGEVVFFHENKCDTNGFAYVGVINDKLGLGCYVKYSYKTLPVLAQWKSMKTQDYALGIEPANAYLGGVANEEYKVLQKGESAQYTVVYGVLDGKEEIAEFERMLKTI